MYAIRSYYAQRSAFVLSRRAWQWRPQHVREPDDSPLAVADAVPEELDKALDVAVARGRARRAAADAGSYNFV